MKKLILRFSSNSYPFSLAIKLKTWSKYSHVDICLPNGTYLGATPLGGVSIHSNSHPIQDFFELEVTELQYAQIMENALSQLGKPYDYAGILGFALARNWQDQDKWFCSEFVAWAIHSVIPLFNEEVYKINPRDISINVKLRKIS